MFDYLGNIIGYIFHKENGMKTKWKGTVERTNDKNCKENYKTLNMTKSNVADLVQKFNREFVIRIYDIRSQIIHYKMQFVKGTASLSFHGFHNSFISIRPNINLLKEMKFLKNEINDPENTDLIVFAFEIVKKSFQIVSEILLRLQQDCDLINNKLYPLENNK